MAVSGKKRVFTTELGPGLKFSYLSESKWKTLSMNVFCKIPVAAETVTPIALVPRLSGRGTVNLPTLRDLARHLEEMYGASLGLETTKIGPFQIVRFGISLPSPRFLDFRNSQDGSLPSALKFLWEVMTSPYLEDGAYPESRFDAERQEHRRDILGIINDRSRYAMVRLIEEVSRGHPSALPGWGLLEDLPGLTPSGTWETWAKALSTCSISMYASGEGASGLSGVLARTGLLFPRKRKWDSSGEGSLDTSPPSPPATVLEIEDSLPGEQTVLCTAFYTGITQRHPLFPALLLYDGILGGFPHSRMFTNIRERENLAYSAATVLNSWRGMVIAVAGIDDRNLGRTRELIIEQFESLKRGEIGKDEMESTRAGLLRRFRSESDFQGAIIRRYLTQEIMGGPAEEEDIVAQLAGVTLEDVIKVANMAELKAVYALRAKDGVS